MRFATELQDDVAMRDHPHKSNGSQTKTSHEIHHLSFSNDLAEVAQHLALAARATNDAVRHWDVGSGRLSWPQGLESLFGYAPSIVSSELGFWQRHLHPEDRARVAASIREALAQEDCEHWSGEYRFRRVDGTYLLLLERAFILRDENGAAIGFVGSLMDITARKQLQDQLCRSQRMEAFGQLASGVAHDFNNFLTTILGYSDLLLNAPTVKGQTAKHIGEIRKAAGRASALTTQLLAFSRKHPLAPRVLEVNTLITNLERTFLRLLGENVIVQCELRGGKEGVHIRFDPDQMTQIILNLMVNARDAMPNAGRVCVTTGTLSIEANSRDESDHERLAPGDYVSIRITDDGAGMSPEVKARLFEPFFTTKESSSRSGLGLATSYGIVRQSGGDIRIESEPDAGTTVTIYIPRVAAPPAPNYKKPSEKRAPRGTETVLVVEDDISVRHLSVRVLRDLGYDVIEAANGDDAQRFFAATDRTIHLVLTDIVMPQMSGHHFAEWLRKLRPKTKIVFISGYLDESLNHTARGGLEMFFLPKPFDPTQLAIKIREALDS